MFPTNPFGLFVDVEVSPVVAAAAVPVGSGQQSSTRVSALGLLDSGSDVTVVHAAILQFLGIPPRQTSVKSQSVAGIRQSDLFDVTLNITDFTNAGAPAFVKSPLLVMDMPSALGKIQVLIGLDVLLDFRLLIDGPGRRFTIDF
jgi:hypothetical protein